MNVNQRAKLAKLDAEIARLRREIRIIDAKRIIFAIGALIVIATVLTKAVYGVDLQVETFARVTAKAGAQLYVWTVPAKVSSDQKGNVVELRGPAGKYKIGVVAIYVDFATQAIRTESSSVVVTLGAVGPVPDVPDNPPDPNPTIPDGKYKLGAAAYKWAASVPQAHRAKAKELASNFTAVAAGIAAGSYTTPTQANKELAGRNKFTLGQSGPAFDSWKKEFFAKWKLYVDKLIADDKVRNVAADYAILYRETAKGLGAIK